MIATAIVRAIEYWFACDQAAKRRWVISVTVVVAAFSVLHASRASAFNGFNTLQTDFGNATGALMGNALKFASRISLAAISLVFLYKIFKDYLHMIRSFGGPGASPFRNIVIGLVPNFIESYLPWIIISQVPNVFTSVMAIAQNIGGLLGIGHAVLLTTPNQIMTQGTAVAMKALVTPITTFWQGTIAAILSQAPASCGPGWLGTPNVGCIAHQTAFYTLNAPFFLLAILLLVIVVLVAGVESLFALWIFTILATDLLIATVEAYISLPLGLWTLGFLGTPLASYVGNPMPAVINAMLRWLTIWLLVTVASSVLLAWATASGAGLVIPSAVWAALPPGPNEFGILGNTLWGWIVTMISIIFGMVALLKIVHAAKDMASRILSGGGSVSGGTVAQSGSSHAMGLAGSAAAGSGAAAGAVVGGLLGGPAGAAAGAKMGRQVASGAHQAAQSLHRRMQG